MAGLQTRAVALHAAMQDRQLPFKYYSPVGSGLGDGLPLVAWSVPALYDAPALSECLLTETADRWSAPAAGTRGRRVAASVAFRTVMPRRGRVESRAWGRARMLPARLSQRAFPRRCPRTARRSTTTSG